MKKLILFLTVLLATVQMAHAGTETYSERREGTALVASSTVPLFTLYDQQYITMATTSWSNSFLNISVKNLLRIGINPDVVQTDYLEGTMTFTIKMWKWTGSSFTVTTESNRVLSLKHDHLNPITVLTDEISSYDFLGAHRIEVYLTAINNISGFNTRELFVQSEIQVERYYWLDGSAVTGTDIEPVSGSPYYEFQWNPKAGAEWYELEWVHIPNTKIDGTEETNLSNLKYNYYRNSTRITVKGNAYRIPAIFDPGHIIFRVRPIGYVGFGIRKEGTWSVTAESGTVNSHPATAALEVTTEYDAGMNWSHRVVYSDNGERFEQVDFIDGLGRPRQTVGHNTETQQAVVSNVYYDELGRPVISDLPTPVNGEELEHYPAFNKADGTATAYQASTFDESGSNACSPSGKGFSTSSGAGRYYSPSNPSQDGANERIPDAEKYPYNRIVYENDFSGRMQKISSYGDDLRTGSGKELFYSYPTANQDELNHLFGAESGNASHYEKMVIVDPNGQIYVQYSDMAGRVIATYQAGQNPAALDPIEGNGGTNYTVSLLPENDQHVDLSVPSSTLTYSEFIYEDASYIFNYAMTPQQFHNACMVEGICLDCVYDLDFRILDACDDTVYTHTETLLGADLDKLCTTKSEETYISAPITLEKGAYTFIKTLRINQDKLQENWCYYIENSTCVEPISDIFNELYEQEEFDLCEEIPSEDVNLSGCEGYRQIMLQDMMPGGQYAQFVTNNGTYQAIPGAANVHSVFTINSLGTGNNWNNQSLDYRNADGSQAFVNGIEPEDLASVHDFITNFQPSWAEALLPFHPEYCFLLECEENAASNTYDSLMAVTHSYQAACSLGLLNPITGYTLVSGCSTSYPDPFFSPGGNGEDLDDEMQAELTNYNGTGASIWENAIYQVYCNETGGDIRSCAKMFDRAEDASCYMDLIWVTYRRMYQELKQQFVYQSMHTACDNSLIGVHANWIDKVARWGNLEEFATLDTDGAGPDTGITPDLAYFESVIEENCETACDAFADDWISQLAGCDFVGQSVDTAALKDSLVALCMRGCDMEHPTGATTAPPGSAGNTSIHEVLLDFLPSGYENNLCTELLISNPGPYQSTEELQQLFEKPLDTCACNEILTAQWTVENNNPNNYSIEEILAMNTGVTLEDANYLVCACEKIHSGAFNPENPNWLAPTYPGITIPSTLSCSEGNGCVGCTEVNAALGDLYDRFSEVPDFETAENYGTILTNYLNNTLNFHLGYIDYKDFIGRCNATGDNPYCTLTPEAKEWAEVMKLIAFRGQLLKGEGSPVDLLADNIVYENGQLQNSFNGNQYWSSLEGSTLTLHFGTGGSNCTIDLTLPEGAGFDFSDIVSFGTMAALTDNCPGENNTFAINVSYLDCGQLASGKLTGTSNCFEINDCVCDTTGLRLCDRITPEDLTACYQPRLNELYYTAENQYLDAIEAMYQPFVDEFNTACATAFDTEKFSYTGPRNTYQYTLFFYDQAGNLVKTISPAGVNESFNPVNVNQARDEVQSSTIYNLPTSYGTNPIPVHGYQITYTYNSYDQVVKTSNPDQLGETKYWYDAYGRVVASQNPVQAAQNRYTYILYDKLGRPYETGQVVKTGSFPEATVKQDDLGAGFQTWVMSTSGLPIDRTEVVYTVYDAEYQDYTSLFSTGRQQNLRLHVASVLQLDIVSENYYANYVSAVHYSYDLHGNVIETVQDIPALAPVFQRGKSTQYEFELISGNVKKIEYQKNKNDQTTHRYTYDKLNRLKEVHLSTDGGVHENREAHYYYFDYGPLARVEIGQQKVQANDYSYTINGWIKGMNSNTLKTNRDAGYDGGFGYETVYWQNRKYAHQMIAADVTGYTNGYFQGDYKSIGTTAFEATVGSGNNMANAIRNLYNGNISHTVTAITGYDIQAGVYSYDQLQRLKKMRIFRNQSTLLVSNSWTGSAETQEFYSDYTYDKNGNLQLLNRNGNSTIGLDMDEFDYEYTTGTNRLRHVADNGTDYAGYADIKSGQSGDYYLYDALGQLTTDVQEGMALTWRYSDRKLAAQQDAAKRMEYVYNPLGQRIMKIEKQVVSGVVQPNSGATTWKYTLYGYGTGGKVMATYLLALPTSGTKTATLDEQMIYSTQRLGVKDDQRLLYSTASGQVVVPAVKVNKLGQKRYELSNYLGNINAVISDKKKVTQTSHLDELNTFGTVSNTEGWAANSPATATVPVAGQLRVVTSTSQNYAFKSFTTVVNEEYTIEVNALHGTAPGVQIEVGASSYVVANGVTKYITYRATSTSTLIRIRSTSSVGSQTFYVNDFSIKTNARYNAVVLSKTDYYPFGMPMTGRSEVAAGAESHRYGYNGMEGDPEMKGQGNSMNYKYRAYDPRLGRFFQQDPLRAKYPELTPYQFASNSPIYMIEFEGLEGVQHVDHQANTTTIVVDFYFVPKSKKGFTEEENGLKNTRFTERQVQRIIKGIYKEFAVQEFVDENNIDEKGNKYKVHLQINAVPFDSKDEMEAAYKNAAYDMTPRSSTYGNRRKDNKAMILQKMDVEIKTDAAGNQIGETVGRSHYGSLETSGVGISHTNTHEMWHNLTHSHINASTRIRTMIDHSKQEPGHFTAGGIFVYANESLGRSLQKLSETNVKDALETLPTIDTTPCIDSEIPKFDPYMLEGENNAEGKA